LIELVLNSEPLNKILDGKQISKEEAFQIYDISKNNPAEVYQTSKILRKRNHKNIVTFSKKAFFNLVNLCRDICTYCTYKAEPNESKLSMMSIDNIRQLAKQAKKYRCVEALFVTGERPEERYSLARDWLKKNGFTSTAEYLSYASEIALNEGLFPHTNAGNLTKPEMKELKKTNVSMGLMLENVSERFTEKEMPHHLAPSKNPKQRIAVLENAGQLRIPMTTGLLVGIGETPFEIIESLYTIKEIQDRYGNIQEIILQNFQPKPDTIMKDHPSTQQEYFRTIVALSRIIMPKMNVQIPPNLSPNSYQNFLSVGINDWGGVSPLTPDYVNPEFSWPQIKKIEEHSRNSGYELKCRFPVYPEFFSMVESSLVQNMSALNDGENLVRSEYWR
jgi:7,8-didemethyl-8-hydroxy-5-deazariboflavin synthase